MAYLGWPPKGCGNNKTEKKRQEERNLEEQNSTGGEGEEAQNSYENRELSTRYFQLTNQIKFQL